MRVLPTIRLFLILILVSGLALVYQYHQLTKSMLNDSGNVLVYQVKKNITASQFVADLKSKSLIHSKTFFLIWIKMTGQEHHLKAGIYQIQPGDSAFEFFKAVTTGQVLKKTFTIVEGTTYQQVLENLKNSPYLEYDEDKFSNIAKTHSNKEGMFLAETYVYDAGSHASDILMQANEDLNSVLNREWNNQTQKLPYQSPYEMLIAASIIEKETSVLREKHLISSVITNRLNKKMRLQVDPTVIYALGEQYQGKLTKKNLQVDSPYNTYKNLGLPPTPIAMVGKDSICAAANPENSDFIYFVAKGDGSHQFSKTYQDQVKAVNRYLKQAD